MCNNCGQRAKHDKRTCPNPPKIKTPKKFRSNNESKSMTKTDNKIDNEVVNQEITI